LKAEGIRELIWGKKSAEWKVRPFAKCPHCGRLVNLKAEHCPECREPIDYEQALWSAAVVTIVTQAIGFANTLKHADLAAVIAIGISIYTYALGEPGLFFAAPLMSVPPLLAVIWWHYKFGRFMFDDEDFVKARREMRWSLRLWMALLAVQLITAAVLWH
jgi:RNA polymerase subunit RPABC4/transcription elongation factor Spt4